MAIVIDAFVSYLRNQICLMKATDEPILMVSPEILDITKRLDDALLNINSIAGGMTTGTITNIDVNPLVMELKDILYRTSDILDFSKLKVEELQHASLHISLRNSLVQCLCGNVINVKFRSWVMADTKELIVKVKNIMEQTTYRHIQMNSRSTKPRVFPHEMSLAFFFDSEAVGDQIQEDVRMLLDRICGVNQVHNSVAHIKLVAIVGDPGIGKTTLAKEIFNLCDVQHMFEERLWLSVNRHPDMGLGLLLWTAVSQVERKYNQDDILALATELQNAIESTKVLIVVDGMLDHSMLSHVLGLVLGKAARGSRILVTTRNEYVARMMNPGYVHRVDKLNQEASWSLLKKQVIPDKKEDHEIERLRETGVKITEICDGLPFAIKEVGKFLCNKRTKDSWDEVLNDLTWNKIPAKLKSTIHLSYEDLPSDLKQCFLYCSLFPKGEVIDCDKVIHMWIAEGFITDAGSTRLENLGFEYYNQLVMRSLLKPIDTNSDQQLCAMHNMIRWFAQDMAKDEISLVAEGQNLSSLSLKLRRLSMTAKDVEFSDLRRLTSLRALLSFGNITVKPRDSLSSFPFLRVLHVNNTSFATLIDSLHHLRFLRYLDLSYTDVSVLPDDIGRMTLLHYICLHGCRHLKELPKSIVKLPKLSFLNICETNIRTVPKEFGSLTSLVSLKGFPAYIEQTTSNWCTLEEIAPLCKLIHLTLRDLQNMTSSTSSKCAKLGDKKRLRSLWLCCTGEVDEQQSQEAFSELCPPPSLEKLTITGYLGRQLPKWLRPTNMHATFEALSFLKLENLPSCRQLPYSLGQLPSLESLCIRHALSIRRIGQEFLVPSTLSDSDDEETDSDEEEEKIRKLHHHQNYKAVSATFPKLKTLVFHGMLKWKEWDWNQKWKAMQALEELKISRCRLRHLPPGLACQAMCLRVITIEKVKHLGSIENITSVVEFYLYSNSNLEKISNLPRLQKLGVSKCPQLKVLQEVKVLSRMELKDYEMETLPAYLADVQPRSLQIYCTLKLLQLISVREGAPEWGKIKHIVQVKAYAEEEEDSSKQRVTWDPHSLYPNVNNPTKTTEDSNDSEVPSEITIA